MNEPALLIDGRPVAVIAQAEAAVKVTDGERKWWEPKENVKRV